MSGDVHVRFCESRGVRFPPATHLVVMWRYPPRSRVGAFEAHGDLGRDGIGAHVDGFLNRFCFIAVRRHRLLPEGGHPDPLAGTGAEKRLGSHLASARRAGQIRLDPDARAQWHDIYARLAEADVGLLGSLRPSRSPRLTPRHVYALLDGVTVIAPAHLQAGLALWDYAARSAAWAIRSASADPVAEQIHTALATSEAGLTRTQLRDLFGRNLPGARIEAALVALGSAGRAQCHRATTAGRAAEIWTAHRH